MLHLKKRFKHHIFKIQNTKKYKIQFESDCKQINIEQLVEAKAQKNINYYHCLRCWNYTVV